MKSVYSFIRSFILSIELQSSAITSTRRLKYAQAKHDHGLQCESWILLKCLHSRDMAGSPWRPSWTSLRTKTLLGRLLSIYRDVSRVRSWSRPPDTPWPRGQHFNVFWLATSLQQSMLQQTVYSCYYTCSMLQFFSRLSSCMCMKRRGFCEICSYFSVFVGWVTM